MMDGYTQPGAITNTNGPGLGLDSVPAVEIDGSNLATNPSAIGLEINASNTTVRGLVINRFYTDVQISSGSNNTIEVLSSERMWRGPRTSRARTFGRLPSSREPTIPDKRNLIGGTVRGIEIGDNSNTGHFIQGNLIDTNKAGTAALNPLSNTFAISLRVVTNSTIGGLTPAAGNVISREPAPPS